MTFIGRQAELALLNERYDSNKFELCIMYGRRRVGKTTLISEFAKDKPCVFFSALQTSAQENLEMLSAAIARSLESNITGAVFQSFKAAFERIFEMAKEQRLLFVIDEYPYLVESQPGISSILQHLIDNNKDTSKALIILNGSSMTQMSEEFFTNNRPLYGRKTFQLKIKPFTFFEMKDFFGRTKPNDIPYIYAVYGGIPKYFEDYQQKRTLKENIMRDFLSIGAPLLDEPEAVLKQEVREPANYNALFAAIANGSHKYSELSSKAKLGSGNISRYLDNLVFLDLIKREQPCYTLDKKKVLYVIDDNMFRFWYRFLPRSLSLINSNNPDIAYNYIKEHLDQYMGSVFEQICREYLWRQNGASVLPFAFAEAGRWWGADQSTKQETEIDLIAHDGARNGLFCECKWSATKVGSDILDELIEKSKLPQFSKLTNKYYCLFSKSGFTSGCIDLAKTQGDVLLITLDTMLE